MDEPPLSSYPRHGDTKRRWTRGQLLVMNVGFVLLTVTVPVWCHPLTVVINALIETWPASVTSATGGVLLMIGVLCGASVFRRLNDPATTFLRLIMLGLIAMVTIPPGTVLLVEGIGYLSGGPR